MAKNSEVLRNIYNKTTNTIGVNGSFYSGGTAQQLTATQDLSTGALNYTTTLTDDFIVKSVYFTFTGAITQDIAMSVNGVTLPGASTITAVSSAYIEGGFTVYGSLSETLTVTCTNNTTPAVTVTLILNIEVI